VLFQRRDQMGCSVADIFICIFLVCVWFEFYRSEKEQYFMRKELDFIKKHLGIEHKDMIGYGPYTPPPTPEL